MPAAPLFPDPGPPFPDFVADDTATFADWEGPRRQRFVQLLAFWHGMAQIYAAILSGPGEDQADDGLVLTATVEDWPQTFDGQQHALGGLMDWSKLRLAWRSLAGWQLAQMTPFTEGQRKVKAALEQEYADSARPMREIPLYRGIVRTACQQVICMPVPQWEAMFSGDAHYEPDRIDQTIIDKVARRLARAFNAPCAMPSQVAADGESNPERPWAGQNDRSAALSQPVVWNTDPRALLTAIDGHGINDRLFDEYLRPIEHKPDQIPTWRFDGVCGQLRITGIGEEAWYATVLAPTHFVATLADLVRESRE